MGDVFTLPIPDFECYKKNRHLTHPPLFLKQTKAISKEENIARDFAFSISCLLLKLGETPSICGDKVSVLSQNISNSSWNCISLSSRAEKVLVRSLSESLIVADEEDYHPDLALLEEAQLVFSLSVLVEPNIEAFSQQVFP
jgi:hypothetical protein